MFLHEVLSAAAAARFVLKFIARGFPFCSATATRASAILGAVSWTRCSFGAARLARPAQPPQAS